MGFILVYHLAVTAFLLGVTANLALNWRLFVAPRARDLPAPPLVSILVPARNESRRIVACLRSLLAQGYPRFELLMLDDNSTDGTAALARGLAGPEALQLLSGAPLPEGWTGKAWACHQLAAAARGEYLLFTDADTVHAPGALSAVISHALATDSALLSAWPRQITGTWSERAVIPLVYVLLLGALPHSLLIRLQNYPRHARRCPSRWLETLGAANGQFMLFTRAAYDAIGGHAAVRDHLVEDVALGRLVAARTGWGMKLVNCDGSRLVDCRMYESFPEVWEGFTKNLRAAFSDSAAAFWIFGVVQAAGLVLPFFLACLPGVNGRWEWIPLAQIAWLYAIRLALALRFRTSLWSVWMHPLGHGLSLLIALNSWRLSARKGVAWKGRTYRMQTPGASS